MLLLAVDVVYFLIEVATGAYIVRLAPATISRGFTWVSVLRLSAMPDKAAASVDAAFAAIPILSVTAVRLAG